jgi:hypothetical protein
MSGRPPRTSARLDVRNAVAEAILEGLGRPEGAARLCDLAAALAPGGTRAPATRAAALLGSPLVARAADGDAEVGGDVHVVAAPGLGDEAAAVAERLGRGVVVADRLGPPPADALERALRAGAALFAAELFFEVHEVLEEAWLALAGAERQLVQGLIQIAVGLHHLGHGNARGARTLLAEGRAKVAPHAPARCNVDVVALLGTLAPWDAAAAAGSWPDDVPLPTFRLRA